MQEWQDVLNHMTEWVQEVGVELEKGLERKLKIKVKSTAIDFVTEMDEWSERFLLDKIRTHYPDHAILSEESGKSEGTSDYEWVIDPIDGTTNYAHGFPMFCISVGLKYKEETVVGVVYAPKLKELYHAVKGEGAYLNGKQIHVSEKTELGQAIVGTGFPYDRATDPLNNVKEFNAVVLKVAGVRRTGSAAIDLCQVSAGRYDGYWEYKLNPWDITAGLLILEEAGGKSEVLPIEGKGLFVRVGNEAIFQELGRLIHD